MGIGRSAFYDTTDARACDLAIVAEMKTICDEFEAYGYRLQEAKKTTRPATPAAPGETSEKPRPRAVRCCFIRPITCALDGRPGKEIKRPPGGRCAPLLGRARKSSRLHYSHAEHGLRRRAGPVLHVIAVGDGVGDQGLLNVGELFDLVFEGRDALLARRLRKWISPRQNEHMHRSKQPCYSTTSSASAMSFSGMVSPPKTTLH
jgi:hypothetical protein